MQHTIHGYLFLHNIGKRNNIGGIIRSACAFNISKVFYVGKQDSNCKKMKVMKDFMFFGNKGTLKKMDFHNFSSLKEAKEYFKENKIFVCGVEIGQGSQPIQSQPFRGDTAFFLGNEGTGLLPMHREICDHFVYIPQYTDKTASLNVGVAAGIVFHHFAIWAQFKEAPIFGQKYRQLAQSQDEESGKEQAKEQPKQSKPIQPDVEFQDVSPDIFKQ